jgi:hypothetical protein
MSPLTARACALPAHPCGHPRWHAGAHVRGPFYRMSIRGALGYGATRVHYLDLDRTPTGFAARRASCAPRSGRVPVSCSVDRLTAKAHRLPSRAALGDGSRGEPTDGDNDSTSAGRSISLVPSIVLELARAAKLVARSRARRGGLRRVAAIVLGLAPESLSRVPRARLGRRPTTTAVHAPDRARRLASKAGDAGGWALRVQLATELVRGFERAAERARLRGAVAQRIAPRVG